MVWLHTYFAEVSRITDQWSNWIYKQKKFSSITFDSASLSRRAIAARWSLISHCLDSLGRINRHNLEKYLSYNHSFHWHSNAETFKRYSKQHFKNNNSFLEEEIASLPVFSSYSEVFQASSWGTRHSRVATIARNRENYRKWAYLVEKARWLRLANRTLGSWLCHRGYPVDFVNLHRSRFTWYKHDQWRASIGRNHF